MAPTREGHPKMDTDSATADRQRAVIKPIKSPWSQQCLKLTGTPWDTKDNRAHDNPLSVSSTVGWFTLHLHSMSLQEQE